MHKLCIQMRRILLACVFAAVSLPLFAGPGDKPRMRHQVRIGWGDCLFETMAFHASPEHIYPHPEVLPPTFTIQERFDYRYTGHIFAEYQFRWTSWLSVGVQVDFEGIFWQDCYFDRDHKAVGTPVNVNNYNVVVMPTVRFDYFSREYVSLYSGLGIGLLTAFDNAGGFVPAPALNLNLIGVQVGHGHWFGTAEIGLMNALKGGNVIFMLGSRIVSFSLVYRW